MSQTEDPLQPVSWTRIEELLKALLCDVPRSLKMYGTVQTALTWRGTSASKRIGLYTTGDKFDDGAIVGIDYAADSQCWITLHCFSGSHSALRSALLRTSRINWDSPGLQIFFEGIPEEMLPLIEECLSHHSFGVTEKFIGVLKWKPPDQLRSCNYVCPGEVRLAPLRLESVDLIKSNWYNFPGAAGHIATLIRHSLSLGVYLRSTGELCAWVLCNECCELGLLHTLEKHRRKGYAQLLCNAMSQRLMQAGIIVRASVQVGNSTSLKLFDSLGFKTCPDFPLFVTGEKLRKTIKPPSSSDAKAGNARA